MLSKSENFKKNPFISILIFLLFLTSCRSELEVKDSNNKAEIAVRDFNIPIAMTMNESYLYPTIVAITSAMENKNTNTSYSFYIMHPGDLQIESKDKILSLNKKYDKISINLIDMGDKYKEVSNVGAHTGGYMLYYKLSLSELLPDLDKIIWLDGDTLTFHDLKEMLEIDMEGYYYKGILSTGVPEKLFDERQMNYYICDGVLLINLKELRADSVAEKFKEFIKENDGNHALQYYSESVLNSIAPDKVGLLPLKYGIVDYVVNTSSFAESRHPNLYTQEEIETAIKDPVILHCISRKPWSNPTFKTGPMWREYAKKTDFFEDIIKTYSLEEYTCA